MRVGKARVWQVHLAVRLCGFPTVLFMKTSRPYHCGPSVSGNIPVRKGYKNAGSHWTARKVKVFILLEYSLLGGISLSKS